MAPITSSATVSEARSSLRRAFHDQGRIPPVAAGDQSILVEDNQGISAFELLERVGEPVEVVGGTGCRDEWMMPRCRGRLEDRAAPVGVAWLHGVGEVAVLGDRKATSASSANNGWTLRSDVSPVVE